LKYRNILDQLFDFGFRRIDIGLGPELIDGLLLLIQPFLQRDARFMRAI